VVCCRLRSREIPLAEGFLWPTHRAGRGTWETANGIRHARRLLLRAIMLTRQPVLDIGSSLEVGSMSCMAAEIVSRRADLCRQRFRAALQSRDVEDYPRVLLSRLRARPATTAVEAQAVAARATHAHAGLDARYDPRATDSDQVRWRRRGNVLGRSRGGCHGGLGTELPGAGRHRTLPLCLRGKHRTTERDLAWRAGRLFAHCERHVAAHRTSVVRHLAARPVGTPPLRR
jgi:hypothetical protein